MKPWAIYKRILTLVLALTIAAGFVGCANESAGDPTVTSAEETGEETVDLYPDDMPDNMNFDGQTIRFITYQVDKGSRSIDIDEDAQDTGDIIFEAIWKRNQAIESRLNVDIQLSKETGMNQLVPAVTMSIQSNSDDYDVIVGQDVYKRQEQSCFKPTVPRSLITGKIRSTTKVFTS